MSTQVRLSLRSATRWGSSSASLAWSTEDETWASGAAPSPYGPPSPCQCSPPSTLPLGSFGACPRVHLRADSDLRDPYYCIRPLLQRPAKPSYIHLALSVDLASHDQQPSSAPQVRHSISMALKGGSGLVFRLPHAARARGHRRPVREPPHPLLPVLVMGFAEYSTK